MEFGDIGSYLPILAIIPVWAACRLIPWYQRTRQSPYETIKSDTESVKVCKDDVTFPFGVKSHRAAPHRLDIMKISGALCLSLFGLYSFVTAYNDNANHVLRRQASGTNSSSVLVDFEVYKPVEFDPPSQGCDEVILLMEHSFGYSYGQPFVG
jgi:hypothetical protein